MTTWRRASHSKYPTCCNWRWCVCLKAKNDETIRSAEFNHRKKSLLLHGRGRRISENLFGTLASRCSTVMSLQSKNLNLTILNLHNMLMTSSFQGICCPAGLADTEDVNRELTQVRWRNDNFVQSMLPSERSQRPYSSKKNSWHLRWLFYEQRAVE